MEVKDSRIGDEEWPEEELRSCVYLGLLCTREKVEDRPNIREVNLMLHSNRITIPSLKFSSDSQINSLRERSLVSSGINTIDNLGDRYIDSETQTKRWIKGHEKEEQEDPLFPFPRPDEVILG